MINYHNVICKFDFPCNCVSSYLRAIIINAPINVKPQGGGGRADPGEFDILIEAKVKFPTPRHVLNVNFPPLG